MSTINDTLLLIDAHFGRGRAGTLFSDVPGGAMRGILPYLLPSSVPPSLRFRGSLPGASIPSTAERAGDYIIVAVAGTSQSKEWSAGDIAVYNGSAGNWVQVTRDIEQIAKGGTGATTASGARANLSVAEAADTWAAVSSRKTDGGLAFFGTSGHRLTGYGSSGCNLGLEDFTLFLRARASDWTPASTIEIWASHTSGNNRATLSINSAGAFVLTIIDNSGASSAFTFTPAVALVNGEPCNVALSVPRAGSASLYLNDQAAQSVSVAAQAAVDIGSGNSNPFGYCSAFNGVLTAASLFNRALSADEVKALFRHGVSYADLGAHLSPYVSNFSAGVDGWEATSLSSITGNVDAIGGENDALLIETGSGANAAARRAFAVGIGKRIQITGRFYRPSSNSTGVGVFFNGAGVAFGDAFRTLAADSWVSVTSEFITTTAAASVQVQLLTAQASGTVTMGDKLYAKDVRFKLLGCVQDLDCGLGVSAHVPDLSNNYPAVFASTSNVRHVRPRVSGDFVVQRVYSHSEIDAAAGVTKPLDLPPNCALLDVEIDRTTAFDSGVTLNVGISGNATKFASAIALAATGKVFADSSSKVSESSSAFTPLYIQKSGATTQGQITIRFRCAARGL